MRGRHLYQLKAFCAIVEQGSFARAASHLGLPASALSQILKDLEARLDTRLLNRTTRSVSLTEAGRGMFEQAEPAFRALENAESAATAAQGRIVGRVRLNATRIAAKCYLAPMLASFLADYPDVQVDIVVEERLADVVAGGFDAGVRLGERLHQDMIAVPLSGDLEMKVVASPGYIEQFGAPSHPRELEQHRCLCFRNPSDASLYRWEFEQGDTRFEIAVNGPVIVDEPSMLPGMAAKGTGIAYQFAHQVDPFLKSGELIQLLADWTPPFPGFYIYYPSRRQHPPAFRAFLDHVRRIGTG
ncbi:LysR family transcriptional regulator [Halomonas sp. HMF6819]|uniref:LysR family transcriptional regulator n=1 Tax=Halomonas sp. HMF6819 TaxID=3373085 RepID=UPI0037889394